MEEKDMELFHARIQDEIKMVEEKHKIAKTNFIDPMKQKYAEALLKKHDGVAYKISGGYTGAERKIILLYPNYLDDSNIKFPLKAISILWNKHFFQLSHRDILGSILGLGIKRDMIGDILLDNDAMAHAFVTNTIAPYIIQNLSRVGRAPVILKESNHDKLEAIAPLTKTVKTSVASLRLDCIISSGFNLSRTKTVPLIKGACIKVNWDMVLKPDYLISQDDVISVRGMGRIRVVEIGGQTRSNRIHLTLEKFV